MPAQPPFKSGASYNTPLDPLREMLFRQWVQQYKVPVDVNAPVTDYDMRGYWQGRQNGNPMARDTQVNPNDNLPHYPDYYKTPTHERFSSESQWAGSDAPRWINNNQLAASNGRIVADDAQPTIQQRIIQAILSSQ